MSKKINKEVLPLNYVMEATGVYHENCAYHLDNLKLTVSIILPNKIKHFAKSFNIKTKNDFVDARLIAKFGAKRNLKAWKIPEPIFRRLKHLVRLHQQLMKQKYQITNVLHSKECARDVPKFVIKANINILKSIEKEMDKIKAQIEKEVEAEPLLDKKVKHITAIKGVAIFSVVTVLAETNGFDLFDNIKQVVSFSGLDVREIQSGSSVKKKPRISKKGNKYIRKVLYFPALNAARLNPEIKTFYDRINKGKNSKKIGIVAVERKLLGLIFTLWKNNKAYNPEHFKNKDLNKKTDSSKKPSALDSSFSNFEQETSFCLSS